VELKKVFLIIADISGYTHFVNIHKASLLHAEEIVTELMEAVIDAVEAPLTLNKLEGDAAFLYARADDHNDGGHGIFRQVLLFFEAFKRKQQALIKAGEGGCFCDACCNIAQLKLKAILHFGEAVIKQVRQLEELAGTDVILVHRLLKNTLRAQEYILITEQFYQVSGKVSEEIITLPHSEEYGEIGRVKALVYYPANLPPEIPLTKRMSRLAGFLEGQRLFIKNFWRRLAAAKPVFHNLPD
jgi:hypothetical protein